MTGMTINSVQKRIRPVRVLPLGFLLIILAGTALLMLPAASADGKPLSFLEALFTATSASCVTGLVVVDTGTFFSPFGQAVLLGLIQLGGLGFMAVATMLFVSLGKRISLRERMTIAESLGENRLQGVVRLGSSAVLVTLAIEIVGAALLSIRFIPMFGLRRGLWYAVFHSVSAFCNAGFDLLGNGQSFTAFSGDALVNFTLMALIVLGGLGFSVLLCIRRERRWRRLTLHAKIVLAGTGLLIVGGAVLIFITEYANPNTLGAMPLPEKCLASLFQSVTLRTAGFNSIDQLGMRDATKLISIFLMLVGGAPAGTAGGLKITTFAMMLLTLRAQVYGREDTEVFGRRIPRAMIRRALCILTIGLFAVVISVTGISLFEEATAAGELGFLNQMYEAVSALCTVGVTTGVTAASGMGTRILLICMMYIGRVGMLTLALAMTGGKTEALIRYPEEEILIG